MSTNEVDEEPSSAAEDVAKRLQNVQMLARSISRWARDYQDKIPKRARVTLNTYESLLSSELLGLRRSLQDYDAELPAALEMALS